MVPSGPVISSDGFMSQTGAFPPIVGSSELEPKVSLTVLSWSVQRWWPSFYTGLYWTLVWIGIMHVALARHTGNTGLYTHFRWFCTDRRLTEAFWLANHAWLFSFSTHSISAVSPTSLTILSASLSGGVFRVSSQETVCVGGRYTFLCVCFVL